MQSYVVEHNQMVDGHFKVYSNGFGGGGAGGAGCAVEDHVDDVEQQLARQQQEDDDTSPISGSSTRSPLDITTTTNTSSSTIVEDLLEGAAPAPASPGAPATSPSSSKGGGACVGDHGSYYSFVVDEENNTDDDHEDFMIQLNDADTPLTPPSLGRKSLSERSSRPQAARRRMSSARRLTAARRAVSENSKGFELSARILNIDNDIFTTGGEDDDDDVEKYGYNQYTTNDASPASPASSSAPTHSTNSIRTQNQSSLSGSRTSLSNSNSNLSALVQKETKWLYKTRILMMFVLLVVTSVAATITYHVSQSIEMDSFTTRYLDFANEIISVSTHINSNNILQLYEYTSLHVTAYSSATSSAVLLTTSSTSSNVRSGGSGNNIDDDDDDASSRNSNWPFIQIPEWDAISSKLLHATNANYVAFSPLVNHDDRTSYETYTLLNSHNNHYQQEDDASNGMIGVFPFIYHTGKTTDFDVDDASSRNANTTSSNAGGGGALSPLSFSPFYRPAAMAETYAPIAQIAPNKYLSHLNHDKFEISHFRDVFDAMVESKRPTLSRFINYDFKKDEDGGGGGEGDSRRRRNLSQQQPTSLMLAPIFRKPLVENEVAVEEVSNPELVGVLSAELPWRVFFSNLIPYGIDGIALVVKNECGQSATYMVNGPEVEFWGIGDLHNMAYDEYEVSGTFDTSFATTESCGSFSIHLYPSDEIVNAYQTNSPIVYTVIVVFIFVGVSLLFILYDYLVESRQEKVMSSAIRSTALINSLFPANVRERLMDDAVQQQQQQQQQQELSMLLDQQELEQEQPHQETQNQSYPRAPPMSPKGKMKRRFSGDMLNPINMFRSVDSSTIPLSSSIDTSSKRSLKIYDSKPIADFFPNSSVLFGDLVGFTAWSSARSPSQVFVLLETLYNSFDTYARKLGVFKVETIGDCYMAACGLPEPREDHAVALTRFAKRCLYQLEYVTQELERRLGPGTNDLAMRIGIHSGPVTAGVLRGEKSRFQLFGDTVNTAARMESTGSPERIQISQKTAELLIAAGKCHWIKARSELVSAKGKGQLQTYWVISELENLRKPTTEQTSSEDSVLSNRKLMLDLSRSRTGDNQETYELERLVTWNVDVFKNLLIKIVARRGYVPGDGIGTHTKNVDIGRLRCTTSKKRGSTALDEVQEFITLPDIGTYQPNADKKGEISSDIDLGSTVVLQLTDFITTIAGKYNNNSFHCYRHACHVLQSVTKLLSRVDSSFEGTSGMGNNDKGTGVVNQFTYWLASDPMVQFACAFAAMIHDVDHRGVPNAQLVKEKSELAIRYKNKSVAEQNSLDLAWGLLMEPRFDDLRACIYTTQEELDRFRQLVVNTVMATDVMDKELSELRRMRWTKAFPPGQTAGAMANDGAIMGSTNKQDQQIQTNRKATIVIEHLVQASDVAHTMQHWHVYVKWNERLFHEMYQAFMSGLAEVDPSLEWYNNELAFFDYYVIPLATKLKDCNAFGVTSEEYLMYALLNRREWELKGKDIVKEYLSTYDDDFESNDSKSDLQHNAAHDDLDDDTDEEEYEEGDDVIGGGDDDDDSAVIDV